MAKDKKPAKQTKKRERLKLPLKFGEAVSDLLKVKPPKKKSQPE